MGEGISSAISQEKSPGQELIDSVNREKLIERLKDIGIWREQEGVPVVDTSALLEISLSNNSKKGVGMPATEIFNLLRDAAVQDKTERVENGECQPERLFILPKGIDDAYNLDWAKYPDGYRYPWEIGRKVSDWGRTIALESGETIRLDELFLIQKIFGEHAAERDESGNLVIYYDEQKPSKFSTYDFCRRTGFYGSDHGGFQNSPANYVLDNCPRLLDRGLFKISDFRRMPEGAGTYFRAEHTASADKGVVGISGVQYIIGKKYELKRVIKADETIAAIIDDNETGEPVILGTFSLATEEEKAALIVEQKQKMLEQGREWSLSGRLVVSRVKQIEPFDPTKSENLRNTQSLLSVSDKLSKEAHIGVHQILTFEEQTWLGQAAGEENFNADRIVAGAKKYGKLFLKSFLSTEADHEMGAKICKISEDLKPATLGWKIFQKYGELVDVSRDAETVIEELFQDQIKDSPELAKQVRTHLLERGRQILLDAYNKLDQPEELAKLPETLENTKGELLLFASACREAKKTGEVDLTEALQSHIERHNHFPRKYITETDKIFLDVRHNYKNATRDADSKDFHEAREASNQRWFFLVRDKKVVSFFRFDDREPEATHFGSYNTREDMRGSGIGSAFLDFHLEDEAMKKPVEGLVEVHNPFIPHYVNTNKLFLTGIVQDGGTYFHMVRDDRAATHMQQISELVADPSLETYQDRFAKGYAVTKIEGTKDKKQVTFTQLPPEWKIR